MMVSTHLYDENKQQFIRNECEMVNHCSIDSTVLLLMDMTLLLMTWINLLMYKQYSISLLLSVLK